MRPSIVVGDRQSGWTFAFNVLYWPLRAFARGMLESVPAVSSAPVDVVSVDYVADAIDELWRERRRRDSARPARSPDQPVRRRARLARSPSSPAVTSAAEPKVLPPDEFKIDPDSREGQALEGSKAYFPYFSIRAVFGLGRHAGPARARRDSRLAAGRLPRATARLRDAQPLGQAPDHARRRRRALISRPY